MTTYLSLQVHTSDGTLQSAAFVIPFLDVAHLHYYIDDNEITTSTAYLGVHVASVTSSQVNLTAPVPAGSVLKVQRETPRTAIPHVYSTGAALFSAQTVDSNNKYMLYVAQEAYEQSGQGPFPARDELTGEELITVQFGGAPYQVRLANLLTTSTGLVSKDDLANQTDPLKGADMVGFAGNTVRDELSRLAVPVERFGAVAGGPDCTAAFVAAIAEAAATSKLVVLGPGVYFVDYVHLPDNVSLIGAGKWATVIKRNTASTQDILRKADGAIGIGVQIRDMSFDGNSANTNDGGVVWDSSDVERGPSVILKNVYITQCRKVVSSRSGENAAVLFYGGTFGIAEDLDIFHNQSAVGLWHKGSDWVFNRLWLGPNAANVPDYNMLVQGGVANKFIACYFGGNGGTGQILLQGTSRNQFGDCLIDNSFHEAVVIDDLGATVSKDNTFTGGQISNSGYASHNTYAAVSLRGASTGNSFVGVHFSNDLHPSSLPSYAVEELYLATGNSFVGCPMVGPWGTSPVLRRSGSSTVYVGCPGYDTTDLVAVKATKLLEVSAAYLDEYPSVTNHLQRLTRGGVSLLSGVQGYRCAWQQAIQDDGSNNPKDLHLNPLGGVVQVGAAGTGMRLISPNGTGYIVTVSNAGALTVSAG